MGVWKLINCAHASPLVLSLPIASEIMTSMGAGDRRQASLALFSDVGVNSDRSQMNNGDEQ